MALCVLELMQKLGIIRLVESLDKALDGLPVLIPLVRLRVRNCLGCLGRRVTALGRLGGRLPARWGLNSVLLSFTTLVVARWRRGVVGGGGLGRRRRGPIIIVNAPHMVPEVPLPGKSISWVGPFTSLISAKIRLISVAVHSVGLTLVSEQAGGGREAGILTRVGLATVRLQVRVHKFAGS